MFSRSLMIPMLLAASIGIPYLATNSPEWMESWKQSSSSFSELFSGNASAGSSSPSAANTGSNPGLLDITSKSPGAMLYPVATPLEGSHGMTLAEVLRMDVTKEWVYARWPRKSTGLADLEHYGIRVPLVSGTRLNDLAGSLTYLFDADGRVERISFRGTTGDTTELVMLLVGRYQLQRQATVIPGEQLYQRRKGNDLYSQLRTLPASVLWSSSPHNSFAVELELQRPDATKPLPKKPLLVAEQPPPPTQTPAAQPSEVATPSQKPAKPQATEAEADPREKWNVLFPRSRVTPGQLNNLDQRRPKW